MLCSSVPKMGTHLGPWSAAAGAGQERGADHPTGELLVGSSPWPHTCRAPAGRSQGSHEQRLSAGGGGLLARLSWKAWPGLSAWCSRRR